MNTKKFVLKNVTQGTQKNVTENQLLELDIDEMVISDAYDTDQVEFYHEGEEFILENPRSVSYTHLRAHET